jgi:hypothetical protein
VQGVAGTTVEFIDLMNNIGNPTDPDIVTAKEVEVLVKYCCDKESLHPKMKLFSSFSSEEKLRNFVLTFVDEMPPCIFAHEAVPSWVGKSVFMYTFCYLNVPQVTPADWGDCCSSPLLEELSLNGFVKDVSKAEEGETSEDGLERTIQMLGEGLNQEGAALFDLSSEWAQVLDPRDPTLGFRESRHRSLLCASVVRFYVRNRRVPKSSCK